MLNVQARSITALLFVSFVFDKNVSKQFSFLKNVCDVVSLLAGHFVAPILFSNLQFCFTLSRSSKNQITSLLIIKRWYCMRKLSLPALLFLSMVLSLTSWSQKASNPVLKVEGGQVKGVETPTKGIIVYKGIPFAAPPVGKLRWREPQPVVPWKGVKTADKYGAAAMQITWDPQSFYGKEWRASGSVPFLSLIHISEP